jgi:hypothetical protein
VSCWRWPPSELESLAAIGVAKGWRRQGRVEEIWDGKGIWALKRSLKLEKEFSEQNQTTALQG